MTSLSSYLKKSARGNMSLKQIAICAFITYHCSLQQYSTAFSTSSTIRQLQHHEKYIAKGEQIDGIMLSMASSGSGQLSKVEALLAKAKELRAQAEAEETQLQSSVLEKKTSQDSETDIIIDELFPSQKGSITVEAVAECLTKKRPSSDMLLRVVDRLHCREVAAKGLDRVERVKPSNQQSQITFETIADENKEDLTRVEGLIDLLIDAANIVDEDFLRNQLARRGENGKVVMHSVDYTHWSSGELSKVLREKAKFLGREYDTQFKNRREEYYEAARKKKGGSTRSNQIGP